jgi:hypothetical protein
VFVAGSISVTPALSQSLVVAQRSAPGIATQMLVPSLPTGSTSPAIA